MCKRDSDHFFNRDEMFFFSPRFFVNMWILNEI